MHRAICRKHKLFESFGSHDDRHNRKLFLYLLFEPENDRMFTFSERQKDRGIKLDAEVDNQCE